MTQPTHTTAPRYAITLRRHTPASILPVHWWRHGVLLAALFILAGCASTLESVLGNKSGQEQLQAELSARRLPKENQALISKEGMAPPAQEEIFRSGPRVDNSPAMNHSNDQMERSGPQKVSAYDAMDENGNVREGVEQGDRGEFVQKAPPQSLGNQVSEWFSPVLGTNESRKPIPGNPNYSQATEQVVVDAPAPKAMPLAPVAPTPVAEQAPRDLMPPHGEAEKTEMAKEELAQDEPMPSYRKPELKTETKELAIAAKEEPLPQSMPQDAPKELTLAAAEPAPAMPKKADDYPLLQSVPPAPAELETAKKEAAENLTQLQGEQQTAQEYKQFIEAGVDPLLLGAKEAPPTSLHASQQTLDAVANSGALPVPPAPAAPAISEHAQTVAVTQEDLPVAALSPEPVKEEVAQASEIPAYSKPEPQASPEPEVKAPQMKAEILPLEEPATAQETATQETLAAATPTQEAAPVPDTVASQSLDEPILSYRRPQPRAQSDAPTWLRSYTENTNGYLPVSRYLQQRAPIR